ncbi:MAG: hypothetical protein QOI73_3358, partial [Solirubrobacteraceae bacterium]|nr:hypothetical protein [Solirubrobacteraceae bacterium]
MGRTAPGPLAGRSPYGLRVDTTADSAILRGAMGENAGQLAAMTERAAADAGRRQPSAWRARI